MNYLWQNTVSQNKAISEFFHGNWGFVLVGPNMIQHNLAVLYTCIPNIFITISMEGVEAIGG